MHSLGITLNQVVKKANRVGNQSKPETRIKRGALANIAARKMVARTPRGKNERQSSRARSNADLEGPDDPSPRSVASMSTADSPATVGSSAQKRRVEADHAWDEITQRSEESAGKRPKNRDPRIVDEEGERTKEAHLKTVYGEFYSELQNTEDVNSSVKKDLERALSGIQKQEKSIGRMHVLSKKAMRLARTDTIEWRHRFEQLIAFFHKQTDLVSKLHEDIDRLNKEIDSAEPGQNENSDDISALNQQIVDLTNDKETLIRENKSLEGDKERLIEQRDTLEKQLAEEKEKLERASLDLAKVVAESNLPKNVDSVFAHAFFENRRKENDMLSIGNRLSNDAKDYDELSVEYVKMIYSDNSPISMESSDKEILQKPIWKCGEQLQGPQFKVVREIILRTGCIPGRGGYVWLCKNKFDNNSEDLERFVAEKILTDANVDLSERASNQRFKTIQKVFTSLRVEPLLLCDRESHASSSSSS